MNEVPGISEEQFEAINAALIKFAETIRRFVTELVELYIQLMVELGKTIEPLVEKIFEWMLEILDFQLRVKLVIILLKWHIPNWIAFRIAKYLPRRVLFLVIE